MGLKKIAFTFLGIGAIFAFTGGLGACAYNCRWYDKNNARGKSYGGQAKRPLDCALTSGIFGIFRAVLALVALILLLVDVNKIVVSALFIIDLVLYLGELIPEALIIDDLKYGLSLPPECDLNSDFYKWLNGDQARAQIEKEQGLTGDDLQKPRRWENFHSFIPGYYTGICYYWRQQVGGTLRFTEMQARPSCVIDYKASTIPSPVVGETFVAKDNCDDYNIVAECRGSWDGDSLTSQVKSVCKQYWKDKEEELVVEGEAKTEDDKKAILDAKKDGYKKYMNYAISDTGAGRAGLSIVPTFLSSFSLANQILLGCQTIAFVATLVGVILLLLKKVAKVSSKP